MPCAKYIGSPSVCLQGLNECNCMAVAIAIKPNNNQFERPVF